MNKGVVRFDARHDRTVRQLERGHGWKIEFRVDGTVVIGIVAMGGGQDMATGDQGSGAKRTDQIVNRLRIWNVTGQQGNTLHIDNESRFARQGDM